MVIAMELRPGIHLVDGVSSNTFLLVEDGGMAIVDTGMPGSGPKIAAYIRAIGRRPEELRHILLTHQHVDHVGGAAELARLTGAQVAAHPLDTPAIAGKGPRELPRPVLMRVAFRALVVSRLRPVVVTHALADGEVLPVFAAEGGLRVVATPGHTTGHVSFYLPGRRALFPGDAYRHRGDAVAPTPAIFSTDVPEMLRSLRALSQLDVEASFPGHGRPIMDGAGARIAAAAR
jgi:glyoxylase-like metal-dependent hydrolase (beta-lactamase superfamily II)